MYDASSPRSACQRSRRNARPSATFTGECTPSVSDFAALIPVVSSSRVSRPAKNDVWLGIPGSSGVPSVLSGPGAQGLAGSRQGPSDALRVFLRL